MNFGWWKQTVSILLECFLVGGHLCGCFLARTYKSSFHSKMHAAWVVVTIWGGGHSNPNHNWIHWNIHIRKVGEAKNSLLSALMLRWRGSCLCERACTKLKGLKDSCPGERAHTQHNGSLLGERACTWAKGWKTMHPGKRVHPQTQWLSPRQKGLCPDDRAHTQSKEVATRLKGKRARTQAK